MDYGGLDKDENLVIGMTEYFKPHDTNNDGKLSKAEFVKSEEVQTRGSNLLSSSKFGGESHVTHMHVVNNLEHNSFFSGYGRRNY